MSSQHASTSTASATAATTSSHASSSASDPLTIVGAILGIIGAILVVVVLYATYRMKRKPLNDLTSPLTGKSLSQHHPAAQITPFGSFGGETPRFRHTPGSDMRIAIRRPDGAWLFSNPHDPFSPYGVSEIDILPSPLSSTASLSSPVKSKGGGDSKSLRNLRSDYDHRYDSVLDLPLPPPAYGYDYSGYIPPFKN